MSGSDFRQMAQLHCRCLSDSMITLLGERYTTSFYRYVERSEAEFTFFERDGDTIVSGCVISEAPNSLQLRLAKHTMLLPWLCLRCYRLPLIAMLKSALTSTPKTRQEEDESASIPELLLIFTSPELRGRGLGATLLGRCEEFLASRGQHRYVIKTIDDEANRAPAFYARHGFVMRKRVVQLGRRFQVWEKSLPALS